jgi:RNA polymerase sigma factor (sigma-70 family)
LTTELAKSDAELLAAVRSGDGDAFGELYARHADAARRLARALVRDHADAEDLVAETFAKVFATLRDGRGPDAAFRAYLFTSLRHVCFDRARRDRRLDFTDDITKYEPGVPFQDTTVAELERSYAARAFAKLPERWRMVLWHTEVEGETPAQIAPLLGLTPNAAAALAYRARERLRQIYLQEHINDTGDPACHWTAEHLGGYVRGALAGRDRVKVEAHLADCAACRLLQGELADVNSGLRGVLAPLVLGGAAPAYLAGATAKSTAAGLFTGVAAAWAALLGWLGSAWSATFGWAAVGWSRLVGAGRRLVQRYGPGNVAAAAGVAAAVAVSTALFLAALVADPLPDRAAAPPPPPPAGQLPAVPDPPIPPPAPTGSSPEPSAPISAAPPPPAPPAPPAQPGAGGGPSPAAAPTSGPPAAAPAFVIAPDVRAARLVSAGTGVVPVTIRNPALAGSPPGEGADGGGGGGTGRLTERAVAPALAAGLRLTATLPHGVRLAGPDAGDGWQCTATADGAACRRAPLRAGATTTARLPVEVAADVTGFQPVTVQISAGSQRGRSTFRLPVAPAGLHVDYATTARVRLAMTGNTLLSCALRPQCLARADNHTVPMEPYLPGRDEPGPPPGLLAPGGPTGPDGPISALSGPKAASGGTLRAPYRAKVLWAGLYWAASGPSVPGVVALHGPNGGWYAIRPDAVIGTQAYGRPVHQAYADVTRLLRDGADGLWWVATSAPTLPLGAGKYAGWSLAIVYADPTAPITDLAVYAGPLPLRRGGEVVVRAADPGRRVEVGLAVWDGDRTLTGDGLWLGDAALGDEDNIAASRVGSAVECGGTPVGCPWHTLGVDVAVHAGRADRTGLATLRAGDDPIEVGVLAVAAEADVQ